MSELKAMSVMTAYQLECNDDDLVYLKSDVDKVIAEKDTENESLLQQNRELCQALQVMYSKEAYDRLAAEIRRLNRALYKALANMFVCRRELAARNALEEEECKNQGFAETCRALAEKFK